MNPRAMIPVRARCSTFRYAGGEAPSEFNAREPDAEQWIRSVKDGGGKLAIQVCKHNYEFALWPTRKLDQALFDFKSGIP
jgi:alpha-L-fucosidase